MKSFFHLFFLTFLFSSCSYFSVKEKEKTSSEIIAIVNTEKLFKEDLVEVLPKEISSEDSLVFVKNYINDWAIKRLLIDKAENNTTSNDLDEIDVLVKDYRESLLINYYKESLIKQQLDTIIADDEIESFYKNNKQNFLLNEELIQLKYLELDIKIKDTKEFIGLFKSDDIEDIEALEKQELSFTSHMFNDSTWVQLDNILLKLPISKENLLKKPKFIQKQDSLSLYLVAVKDILLKKDIAPLEYIKPTITQMILHKRKIELVREIEKILIQDATKNNNFKIY